MAKVKDITGMRFGKLVVLSFNSINDKGTYVGSLWNCLCDCGNEVVSRSDTLLKGAKKSCGCLTKFAYGESSFNYLYDKYQRGASSRNLSFELSREVFKSLTKQDCHYCGEPPSTVCTTKNYHGEYIYNGVDRMDNSLGYTEENSVPCCPQCNYAKGTTPYDIFVSWIARFRPNS